jgi:cardiolipin synthase A/B
MPQMTMQMTGHLANTVQQLSLPGATNGNEVTIYVDGSDAFEALHRAIRHAQTRVWLETFIFEPDATGMQLLDALTAAASRGVQVLVMVDAMGSPNLRDEHTQALRNAGGQVHRYNPLRAWQVVSGGFRWFTRDHRKIWLIDDVGFTGGMNLGADYAGTRMGNGRFRDTQVLLQGPCVSSLESLWLDTWRLLKLPTPTPTPHPPASTRALGQWVQVLGGTRHPRQQHIQRTWLKMLHAAQQRTWWTTPYFMPPLSLMRAMERAARRGVDVRLLTAGKTDVPVARLAARYLAHRLIRKGVRIFEYQAQALHAKTVVVDGEWSAIGSFNLDRLSHQRNREVAATFLSVATARSMEEQFHRDCAHAVEVTAPQHDAWWRRMVGYLAYRLQGFLAQG